MFVAALVTVAKKSNDPNVHQLVDAKTKDRRSKRWNITQPQKGVNLENLMQSEKSHTVYDFM